MSGAEREVVLIGPSAADVPVVEVTDKLVEGVIVLLQEFDTPTLRALVEYRRRVRPDGWIQQMVEGYLEVWREGS